MTTAIVRAPGRVNLIGDHTDYTGGLVLPMAIDRWTQITYSPDDAIQLTSADETDEVRLPLQVRDPASIEPRWGRYIGGVVAELQPTSGIRGHISTDIPIGAGLSSSAALEVAVALALGSDLSAVELAQLCQRAERRASGVPTGIMDQLCIAGARAGHGLLIDCSDLTTTPIPMPADAQVVVQFVASRTLIGSEYGERVAQCALAEQQIGPLRLADLDDVAQIADPIVRARAMHVIGENRRVREFAAALLVGDLHNAGQLMTASHASLRLLYRTSTPQMDAAVASVMARPGVYGARMTGGGFGGCLVALTRPGADVDGWIVHPVDGAVTASTSSRPHDVNLEQQP